MKKYYRALKKNPLFTLDKNDLIIVDENVVQIKPRGHCQFACSKDQVNDEVLDMMVKCGFIEEVSQGEYSIGDIVAVRSGDVFGDKNVRKKKRWTVSICHVTDVQAKMTYKDSVKVVLTVHDIYGDPENKAEVQADKVIGKTTKYWYINSHNEVVTDYFYRSEYDDKIRMATGNCFIDDESCRAKIRENEQKMNELAGREQRGWIDQTIELFNQKRKKENDK